MTRRYSGAGWRGRVVRDAALVAALSLSTLRPALHGGSVDAATVALGLALALPLLWRRRAPQQVFAVVAAVAFVQWNFNEILVPDIALLVALYTVAARLSGRRTLVAVGVLECGVLMAALRWHGERSSVLEFILLSGMVTAAAVIGTNARVRRAYLAEVEQRADRLERERDQRIQLAASAERTKIARDVHDIVAHSLSVMIALADGAGLTIASDPDRARQATAAASATGRSALADMRRILGVLRDVPLEMAPRLPTLRPVGESSDLDALLAQVRGTGLAVTLMTEGAVAEIPATLQSSIYRLVQESLTNTLKHGVDVTATRVSIVRHANAVLVEIVDNGVGNTGSGAASVNPVTAAPARPVTVGSGLGLVGMRERAAAFGGSVEAGPTPSGGWRVRARLLIADDVAAAVRLPVPIELAGPTAGPEPSLIG